MGFAGGSALKGIAGVDSRDKKSRVTSVRVGVESGKMEERPESPDPTG